MEQYNVYCDESCHLENDHQKAMVLGAVWCPRQRAKEIYARIREIKTKHKLPANFEIKWVKVSPAKIDFYLDIVNYFYDLSDLHFRALVVPDKTKLNHGGFNQNHDDWYYKMYYVMIKTILKPCAAHSLYIDIKDTCSAHKTKKLQDILRVKLQDTSEDIVERVQTVRSHEIEIMQMTDLLIGAVSYVARGLNTSGAKSMVIECIRKRSKYSLLHSTLPMERKTNIFYWDAQEVC